LESKICHSFDCRRIFSVEGRKRVSTNEGIRKLPFIYETNPSFVTKKVAGKGTKNGT
jgi:hypothetical protein